MIINHIDHIVLTTRDIKACTDFYTRVLGMELFIFGENRTAFLFGQQKINVHEYGNELEPKAHLPVPGSLDLCFIVAGTIDVIIDQLQKTGIVIIEGPVRRTGACGAIMSCYIRDPDLNLIELSCYI
ncbi:glyoxalase/Bleomycin resistance /Dioxygenase superfamily protein [Yersinia ruckeri]|uniref:VOC family protein n=1 Tax=Yersinia ruckeri TaxID=29486 RepID=UPI0005ABB757|nr:VOC family protein [Yersinia ruckeri]AJI96405.1 glyoxalase/Bleomycin resistance /Dioxygenase superfamily protein [Yersinia ruckeri]MCW6568411.1 VOC family protein [Yersinia ruckeri]